MDASIPKTVTFLEPADTATIAVKVYYENEVEPEQFSITCTSTRAESPWNFATTNATSNAWRVTNGTLPVNWFANSLPSDLTDVVEWDNFTLLNTSDPACPGPLSGDLGTLRSRSELDPVFAFRRSVVQPTLCTNRPTASPSAAPSNAPTPCPGSFELDIIWVVDGSRSMAELNPGLFEDLMHLISNSTKLQQAAIGPNGIRQGFLKFAGPQTVVVEPFFNQTIAVLSNLTDPNATSPSNFSEFVLGQAPVGGSTDSPGALLFVQNEMFTASNFRPGSKRLVIFASDGWSTDENGTAIEDPDVLGTAVNNLKAATGAKFMLIPVSEEFPSSQLLVNEPDFRVAVNITPSDLVDIIYSDVMCLGEPTSQPSASPIVPTFQPSTTPTQSPVCVANDMVDLLWMIDESTISTEVDPVLGDQYSYLLTFIQNFTRGRTMGPTTLRQGYVEYAGPFNQSLDPGNTFALIGDLLNVSDPAAESAAAFTASVANLVGAGGTLDMAGALNYVREEMLKPGTKRPGSKQVVIMMATHFPSDINGEEVTNFTDIYNAALQLKADVGVRFVVLKSPAIIDAIPNDFMVGIADYIVDIAGGFATLPDEVIQGNIVCTGSPTMEPVLDLMGLNEMDLSAFNQLSEALDRPSWTECNKTNVDPCEVCYNPNEDHAIICDTVPTSGGGRRLEDMERRIVGLRLRNLGIKGLLPVELLESFGALRELRLSSDSLSPSVNRVKAGGKGCVDPDFCARVNCDLDGAIPICGQEETRASSEGVSVAVIGGLAAGLGAIVLIAAFAVVRVRSRRSQGAASKGAWEHHTDRATGQKYSQNMRTGEFAYSSPLEGADSRYDSPDTLVTFNIADEPLSVSATSPSPSLARSRSAPFLRSPFKPSKPSGGRETKEDGVWVKATTGEFEVANPAFDTFDVESAPDDSPKRVASKQRLVRSKSSTAAASTTTALAPVASPAGEEETNKGFSHLLWKQKSASAAKANKSSTTSSPTKLSLVPSASPVAEDPSASRQWKPVRDEETGEVFWINSSTGEFSWTNPSYE